MPQFLELGKLPSGVTKFIAGAEDVKAALLQGTQSQQAIAGAIEKQLIGPRSEVADKLMLAAARGYLGGITLRLDLCRAPRSTVNDSEIFEVIINLARAGGFIKPRGKTLFLPSAEIEGPIERARGRISRGVRRIILGSRFDSEIYASFEGLDVQPRSSFNPCTIVVGDRRYTR